MKQNKKLFILFTFLIIVIFFLNYEFLESKKNELPSKSVLSFDKKVFEQFHKKFDINQSTNRYWGIAEDAVVEEEILELNSSKQTQVSKEEGSNVLCISESCYRLIGVHQDKESTCVSLYNKNLKERVKDYRENEILEEDIIVKSIDSNRVLFAELNTTRVWNFKIFDVNQTKYKPKVIEQ